MSHDNSENLGSLPKADRNAELARLSIAKFQAFLPVSKFVFRAEPIDDAGVDGSLELLIDGCYTNLRSQVQLKSTDSQHTNTDGTISVPVRVSNLNHLLNGSSPIYVLYIAPKEELRFVWAHDERKRLDESTPNWMQQEWVSLRFQQFVTPETLERIHERIRQEARFHRALGDILDAASSVDQVVVSIDPETLDITDPEEAKRILMNSGTVIVSAGYATQVEHLIRVLAPTDAKIPRILLVHAHAEYNSGRYQHAIALAAEASLRSDELSVEDRVFLKTIQDGCDFQTGRITMDEFAKRLEQHTRSEAGGFDLSNRLQRIRYAIRSDRDPERRAALLAELCDLVEYISRSDDLSGALKIHARICLVEAEGHEFVLDSMREIAESRMKIDIGRVPDLRAMFRGQAARLQKWDEMSVAVLKDSIEVGNPYVVADAMLTRGNISYSVMSNQKASSVMFGQTFTLDETYVQNNIHNAMQALKLFSQASNLEGELRAKMLIADLCELMGRVDEAQAIAREVLPKAKAMAYSALVYRAEEHIAGRGLQSRLASSGTPRSHVERAKDMAETSDEELIHNAAQMLRVHNLPSERLPIMEREYASFRDIAREQVTWCRHIELIQDKRHELHPSTHYRTDPTRFCLCTLHGYRSMVGDQNWDPVISAFKRTYCESCPDRNPFES